MHSSQYKKFKKSKEFLAIDLSRSFTLIELLVAISIISLLSSVVLVSTRSAGIQSRDSRRKSDIEQVATALELYYLDNNNYPNTDGAFLYADSRNPPNLSVPAYSNLMTPLVPKYLSRISLPPNNNSGDGAMCGNCDEYRYQANSFGVGYMICTYLAKNVGGSGYNGDGYFYGTNGFGPFYCISNGCGAGSDFSSCQN